jgi:hypothetical protein
MASHPINRLRVGLALVVSLAIWSLLAWRHLHNGVPAHHLFHNPELPRVSDWIGHPKFRTGTKFPGAGRLGKPDRAAASCVKPSASSHRQGSMWCR